MTIRMIALIISAMMPIFAHANSINTTSIIKSTLAAAPHCLHYKIPTHFCLWISEFGKINMTPVLDHYLPDLVVTVFNKPEDNPWFEISKTLDKAGKPVQEKIVKSVADLDVGSGNHSLQDENEQHVIFKEVDVIGNPALVMFPAIALLPSTVREWFPYYQSMSDSLLWRGLPPAALPEEGMALGMNVMHHIGKDITNWGGMYPHEGKVINDNEVKASAVIAARAADLLSNQYSFTHICKRLSTDCGEHCHAAVIQENSDETYFQMIYPIVQEDCHVLGDSGSYTPDMMNKDGSYVWVVWRHYEGCANGDGIYLGRT